jgi:alpha-N-arabinofuranosidase
MYVPFQDAAFVPVRFDAGAYTERDITLPRLDAIAARDKSGKLWLAITNLDPAEPADIEADLAGSTVKSAAGETLTAAAVDSVNTFERPNTVAPKPLPVNVHGGKVIVKVEPKSVTVISAE